MTLIYKYLNKILKTVTGGIAGNENCCCDNNLGGCPVMYYLGFSCMNQNCIDDTTALLQQAGYTNVVVVKGDNNPIFNHGDCATYNGNAQTWSGYITAECCSGITGDCGNEGSYLRCFGPCPCPDQDAVLPYLTFIPRCCPTQV